jgi:hypothetical protein
VTRSLSLHQDKRARGECGVRVERQSARGGEGVRKGEVEGGGRKSERTRERDNERARQRESERAGERESERAREREREGWTERESERARERES